MDIDQVLQADPQRHGAPIHLPFGRDGLALMFSILGFKCGVEVGVAEGEYSEVLCKTIPDLHLICVDAWTAYKGYRDHTSQSKLDGFYTTALLRLAPYDCEIVRAYSLQAAERVQNGSLDFVYIDGNHSFLHVTQDLAAWSPKVRFGGIIAGHDFRRSRGAYECRVKDVIPAWAYAYGINPWFLTNDFPASWFWVKK